MIWTIVFTEQFLLSNENSKKKLAQIKKRLYELLCLIRKIRVS